MNITKKNMTFTLEEESGGYSFDGERQVGNDGSGDADSTLTGKQARLIEF